MDAYFIDLISLYCFKIYNAKLNYLLFSRLSFLVRNVMRSSRYNSEFLYEFPMKDRLIENALGIQMVSCQQGGHN